MEEKELRLGNLINEGQRVTGIMGRTIFHTPIGRHKTTSLRIPNIKPIILTKEWLLKLGLGIGWINHFYFYTFNNSPLEAYYKVNGSGQVDIKYVHQLQNLWFALNGEELEIKK